MAQNKTVDRYLYYTHNFIAYRPYQLSRKIIHILHRRLSCYRYERITHWLNYENKILRNTTFKAGLGHNRTYLKNYISQAIAWNRVPVIHPLILDFRHNFDCPVNQEWETYYDLNASSIHYDNGKVTPLPYIHSRDFFPLLRANRDNVLIIDNLESLSQKDNDKYKLVLYQKSGGVSLPLYPGVQTTKFQITLLETSEIRDIGNDIARQLGKNFYVFRYRYPDSWDPNSERFSNRAYYRKINIDRLVRKLPKVIPPGSNLYIMANIWKQPNYFDKLRKIYKLFTYNDFPTLRELIETKYPNTFLLLVIEEYIARKSIEWVLLTRNTKDLIYA